jgi:serine/threonine protein kinase
VRFGRYEVVLPIAEGPLGKLFVGRDPALGRQVAIKVPRSDADLPRDAKARLMARFREAGRAFAALSHPGFTALHDIGEDEHGAPYLVFELVDGPTLRERLAAGPLPPSEVASLGRAIGAALTHAHEADFVHGDVKPENVMLSPVGAKLTDPGLSWLAREQAATPYDDQLGLATVLYEALTGKPPALAGPRQPPSAVAPNLRSFPHLDTIFERALATDPRKRFSSCDVLGSVVATELEGIESGRLGPASVSSIVPRATRRWQNTAAGAAVLVIGTLVLLGRPRRSPGDGVSLRSVSSAFFAAIAGQQRAAAHAHHPQSVSGAPATASSEGSAAAVPEALADRDASPGAERTPLSTPP